MNPAQPPPLPEDPDPALGRVIQGLREQLGMSRPELAERSGVDPVKLARIEAGAVDPPWPTVQALAGALGVSVAEIATAVVAEEEADAP